MPKFCVLRVRRVVTAEVAEVEAPSGNEANTAAGRVVASRRLRDYSHCRAVIEAERYDEAWLARGLARIGDVQ